MFNFLEFGNGFYGEALGFLCVMVAFGYCMFRDRFKKPETKAQVPETPAEIASLLGPYVSHDITGQVYLTVYGDIESESLLAGIVCYDQVSLMAKGPTILFPVENQLTIQFERGEATFIRFNLKFEELCRLRSVPAMLLEIMRPDTSWLLSCWSFTDCSLNQ